MTRHLGVLALLVALGASPGPVADPPQTTPLALAERYLKAREATMQLEARPADVEAVLALCSESMVYEHPRAGITMNGLAAPRAGMIDFLGGSRNARITIKASLPGRDVVAVQTDVAFEGKEGDAWTPVKRQQLWVFEIADNKIRRIIEYW